MKKYYKYIIPIVVIFIFFTGYSMANTTRKRQERVIEKFAEILYTISDVEKSLDYFEYSDNDNVKSLDAKAFNKYKPLTTDKEFNRLLEEELVYNYILGAKANNFVARVVSINVSKPTLTDEKTDTYVANCVISVEIISGVQLVKIVERIPAKVTLVKSGSKWKIDYFDPSDETSFLIPARR